MTTKINSNGSKWGGQEPDSLETLLDVLARETLDPTFEEYGDFAVADPVYAANGEPIYPKGTIHFWGNFLTVSHVFDIASDDPDVCERLFAAIRANKATQAYANAKRAEAERKAKCLEHHKRNQRMSRMPRR